MLGTLKLFKLKITKLEVTSNTHGKHIIGIIGWHKEKNLHFNKFKFFQRKRT